MRPIATFPVGKSPLKRGTKIPVPPCLVRFLARGTRAERIRFLRGVRGDWDLETKSNRLVYTSPSLCFQLTDFQLKRAAAGFAESLNADDIIASIFDSSK
jgi:hypothetical protein